MRVLSVDWTSDLAVVRRTLPANVAVQGNLDPVLMQTTPAIVTRETTRLLESMRGTTGHIFNLGHGILPQGQARVHGGAGRNGHGLEIAGKITRRENYFPPRVPNVSAVVPLIRVSLSCVSVAAPDLQDQSPSSVPASPG